MDTQEEHLKGLPTGVVLSAVFDRARGTLNILAVYSPGVRPQSGTLEQMVRWAVALHMCRGGQRVLSALAFKSLGRAGVEDMYLRAFCGSSVLYAFDRMHLLQALGLADDQALAHHDGWARLQSHVRLVANGIDDFTSAKCFFDEVLARKCAAARKAMLAAKGK